MHGSPLHYSMERLSAYVKEDHAASTSQRESGQGIQKLPGEDPCPVSTQDSVPVVTPSRVTSSATGP